MQLLDYSLDNDILTIKINHTNLSLYSIPEIQREYKNLKNSINKPYTEIVMDMEMVEYADSSGISFLVRTHIESRSNLSQFKLKNLCERVRQMLDYAKLTKDFNIAG